ncbi:hypothetical protein Dimus_032045 [Dionaea muscipula]
MFRESWMIDNGLSNVMDLIKRQKWERLFKRRELMHIDAVKEFYARLTLVHYKKKDVARSRVRGVDIEFDYMRLASITGVPGNNGICEYMKEEIGKSAKSYDKAYELCNLNERPLTAIWGLAHHGLKRENGASWLSSGENRRRDDEEATPAENEEGESGSDDQFYDAQVEVEEPVAEASAIPVFPTSPGDSPNLQKEPATEEVDPLAPTGSIPESVMLKLQAELEQARARRIQADLEKAQDENARLLALL